MVGSEDDVEDDGVLRHLNSALLAVRICLIVLVFFMDCDKLELFVSTSSLLILVSFVTALCMHVVQRMMVIYSRLPESVGAKPVVFSLDRLSQTVELF